MAICLDDFAQSIWTDGAGMVGLARQSLDPEDFRRLWDRIMRLFGVYQNRITKSLSRKIYGPQIALSTACAYGSPVFFWIATFPGPHDPVDHLALYARDLSPIVRSDIWIPQVIN
ncbi:hypothetical protein HNQ71_006637 [Mesorhizobium sangaii]|uniref:Uncharacterized protein n=1 Tax=Mesorhizobium sangaii TaxID=505389 RepID=A0A841PMN3_9HYPH|nr:hypothetical protein [Mesorhizobium sangaii]